MGIPGRISRWTPWNMYDINFYCLSVSLEVICFHSYSEVPLKFFWYNFLHRFLHSGISKAHSSLQKCENFVWNLFINFTAETTKISSEVQHRGTFTISGSFVVFTHIHTCQTQYWSQDLQFCRNTQDLMSYRPECFGKNIESGRCEKCRKYQSPYFYNKHRAVLALQILNCIDYMNLGLDIKVLSKTMSNKPLITKKVWVRQRWN